MKIFISVILIIILIGFLTDESPTNLKKGCYEDENHLDVFCLYPDSTYEQFKREKDSNKLSSYHKGNWNKIFQYGVKPKKLYAATIYNFQYKNEEQELDAFAHKKRFGTEFINVYQSLTDEYGSRYFYTKQYDEQLIKLNISKKAK